MKSKNELEKQFLKQVYEIMKKGNDHGYLEGTVGIVKSKIYMDGICEEIEICKKYFQRYGRILDFGTGAGLHSWFMSFEGYKTIGIDIDNFGDFTGNTKATENMDRDQKKLWSRLVNKNKKMKFLHYKDKIPFEKNYFDGIIASAVLEHIPNKQVNYFLSEIRRVLKPGGYLLISRLPRKFSYLEYLARLFGMGHHERLYKDNESKDLIKSAGFKIEKFWITDFCPSYPLNLINNCYPWLTKLNSILLKTPVKFLAHDIRMLARKI